MRIGACIVDFYRFQKMIHCLTSPLNMSKINFIRHDLTLNAIISTGKGSVTDLSKLCPYIFSDCICRFNFHLVLNNFCHRTCCFGFLDLSFNISQFTISKYISNLAKIADFILSCWCKTFNLVWWSLIGDSNASISSISLVSFAITPLCALHNCLALVKFCLHCFIHLDGTRTSYH